MVFRGFVDVLLAAAQLLAERGQGLVRGEGAAVLRLLGRVGRRLADLRRGLGVGLLRVGELLAVRLEPLAGGGVALLPLLALGVVALEPLLRLGVEALGVDVVALVVVLGL